MTDIWESKNINDFIGKINNLQKERDGLAARCERLEAVMGIALDSLDNSRYGYHPIDTSAYSAVHKCLLNETIETSLARHDAELLRKLASDLELEIESQNCHYGPVWLRTKANDIERDEP